MNRLVLDQTGSKLVSTDSNGMVAFWDTAKDEPLLYRKGMDVRLTYAGPSAGFTKLTVAGCAEEIVLEATRWQVTEWKLEPAGTLGEKAASTDGFTRAFDQLVVSPDGRRVVLVTCSQKSGGECQNPDIEALVPPANTPLGHPTGPRERITDVRFSPDGAKLLVSGCETRNFDRTCANPVIKLFNAKDMKELAVLRPLAIANASSFTADGNWLLTGTNEGSVELWDLLAGRTVRQFNSGKSAITAVAITPNGRRLAWGTFEGTLWTWDPVTEKQPAKLEVQKGAVLSAAFSGDSRRLAASGADRIIRLYEVNSSIK